MAIAVITRPALRQNRRDVPDSPATRVRRKAFSISGGPSTSYHTSSNIVLRIIIAYGRFHQLPAGDPPGGVVAGDLLEGADAGGGTGAVTFTNCSQIRDDQIERIGCAEFDSAKVQMLADARAWRLR